jgi:3-deoxy-D-manno-oct-2-ulosonic acid (Kdo) hydroxylase
LIEVVDYTIGGWAEPTARLARSRWYCERLEEGQILIFPATPFAIADEDRDFLVGVRQTTAAYHKNISYRPAERRIRGLERGSADAARLGKILQAYSERVTAFAREFLAPYARGWQLDFASFRSIEERSRDLMLKSRNDLLHTDAFPTRPTNGNRILRIFTNVNPSEPRVWLTAESFDVIAPRLAAEAGLLRSAEFARSPWRPFTRILPRLAGALGLPLPDRSPYDRFMLGFHDYLKANQTFQESSPKSRWQFPPNSTWIVFTDAVPHAVLSGRFALEQTYIVSERDLVLPEKSPLRVLEKLCGTPLTN